MVGDAVSEADLTETLATRAFNVAIVLGTHAMAEDSPEIQDCRVLTCCLLLRQLNSTSKTPIRIVSENNLDQTVFMAIAPQTKFAHAPDFINTQAIFARALVLTAAYPEMGPAVNELFEGGHQQDDGKGRQIQEEVEEGGLRAPEIDLLQSSTLGLAQKNVAFGAVQAILAKMFDTNDMGTVVVVGYYVHVNGTSELVLAPELNSTRLWNAEDQIIVLTREKKRKSQVNRRRMSAAGVSSQLQSMASGPSAASVDSMVLPGTPAVSVTTDESAMLGLVQKQGNLVIAPVDPDLSGEPAVAEAADNVPTSPINQQCAEQADSPPCESPREPSSPISEHSSPIVESRTLDSKTKKDKKDKKKDKKEIKEKKSKGEEADASPTVEAQPRVENASAMPAPRLQPTALPALASSPGALGALPALASSPDALPPLGAGLGSNPGSPMAPTKLPDLKKMPLKS